MLDHQSALMLMQERGDCVMASHVLEEEKKRGGGL